MKFDLFIGYSLNKYSMLLFRVTVLSLKLKKSNSSSSSSFVVSIFKLSIFDRFNIPITFKLRNSLESSHVYSLDSIGCSEINS